MVRENGEHAAAATNGYPANPHSSEPSRRSFYDVCNELRSRVEAFLAEDQKTEVLRNVQSQLRVSMGVVEEALERYSLEQISLSYNGGKDCLVLLIMLLACLARRYPSPSQSPRSNDSNGATSFPSQFQAVYIVSKHPFAEVDDFVETTSSQYHLDVKRYAMSMKEGLGAYLADRPSVKAIFVGTRRTDPHGEKLTHFDPTDSGWPDFMRVHPVIDWHYGGTQDTHPNPQLKKQGENGVGFRPAYELTDDDEERLGRDR
ncbi:putative phosphoadenosine phosphosulfate reductase [Colletotrichum sublineola]|uniref:FAD synthase n=1 Tax=Colletotrichum sublineola TaxID=1173701 RepID=A0A066X548_COLSU|nr:putative phosphoadenosine phosphosulfate reductase [Colletotrichum sublineola]